MAILDAIPAKKRRVEYQRDHAGHSRFVSRDWQAARDGKTEYWGYNPCGHRVHPANHSETIHDTTHSQIARGGTGIAPRTVMCDSGRNHSAR